MHLSTARIGPLAGSVGIGPDQLVQLLWRNSASSQGIEHIRVRAGPTRLDIAIFTSAVTQATADEMARNLIHSTLTTEPELRLWRLL